MRTYIQFARKDLSMTQSELAQKMGVTQGAIALWESSKRIPSLHMLYKLSRILDVPITQLVDAEMMEKIRSDSKLQDIDTPPRTDDEWEYMVEQARISENRIEKEMKDDRIRWLISVFPDLTEEGVEKVAEYMKDICQLPKYSRRKWRDEGKENNGDT